MQLSLPIKAYQYHKMIIINQYIEKCMHNFDIFVDYYSNCHKYYYV